MHPTSQRPSSRRALAGIIAGAALVLAACSSGGSPAATSGPTATSAGSPAAAASVVKSVTDAKLGDYLTGPNGLTLYVFTKDTGGTSACTGACATSWPPFVLSSGATAQAGTGVTGTFATITRADGTTQVTYMGAPLYYFAKDRYAGDVTGQGVGGVWFVAATAGGPGGGSTVTPPPPSATAASSAAGSASSVDVFDYGFGPATLTVAVGTTVTWTKSGSAPHTVTSDDGAFPGATLTAGQPYAFTFTKAGTYAYHCAIHASMTGTVVVK